MPSAWKIPPIDDLGVVEERLANAAIARTAGLDRVSWEQAPTVLLSSWLELASRVPEPIRELTQVRHDIDSFRRFLRC